ncbi:expressed unknown protein [Seminavis robusta]|uniref:RXYLT1 C-terminal domain-containing protein n=1 Tax=Seminavis robusta TaxID=568900 RepID=A0A9N8ENP7_9STRA|nr:expressed unknown protein [Seminavis robusta]|eukprot:Sro1541_g280930.1 n/a (425) ;mRNA; f:16559-17833
MMSAVNPQGWTSPRQFLLLWSLCACLVVNEVLEMPRHFQQYLRVPQSQEIDLSDLEAQFHTKRLQVLQRLKETDLLEWGAYEDFKHYVDNFQVYVLNKTADPSPPLSMLTNYTYFYLPDKGGANLCWAATLFHTYYQQPSPSPLPHILITSLNRDWGAFSVSMLPGVYIMKSKYEQNLQYKKKSCLDSNGTDILGLYLNHPDTKAVISTQAHDVHYEKAHSLALGLEAPVRSYLIYETLKRQQPRQTRPDIMYVSAKEWDFRQGALKLVEERFHVSNQYQQYWGFDANNPQAFRKTRLQRVRQSIRELFTSIPNPPKQYYLNMSHSKFVFSPVGFGMDCYRNWEALYLGSIPIIETRNRTQDNWFRVFDDLPVALIDHFDNLTPEWLEAEYVRILGGNYRWEKLTKQYWVDFTKAFLDPTQRQL